jgi:DNA-binding NtrC family response regulator
VAAAAADERHVLIRAEEGLDTEAVAREIHLRGSKAKGPFVTLTCSGVVPAQLEKALFGARAAARDLDGLGSGSALARALGGVLFISDLEEMPAPLQRRLARTLRDGEVRLPRRATPVALDVLVIASGREPLEPLVREDLLRRFAVSVDLPPLRQRRDDVPVMAQAMLAARDASRRFTPAALTVLAALPWRRNTAELAGLVERLTTASGETTIRQEEVLAEVQLDRPAVRPAGSLRDARRQFEREFIASVLRDHSWQMRDAARALGIERANLYRKARQLGIQLPREGTRERIVRVDDTSADGCSRA